MLEQILRDLEAGGLRGCGFELHLGQTYPERGGGIRHWRAARGQRAFGKEARYRPLRAERARSVAGRLRARIRTRWTSAVRCAPASWPRNSFAQESTKPACYWAGCRGVMRRSSSRHRPPSGGVNLQVPRSELPPKDWFTIKSIVRDLELEERDWAADLLAGYFCQSLAPWER